MTQYKIKRNEYVRWKDNPPKKDVFFVVQERKRFFWIGPWRWTPVYRWVDGRMAALIYDYKAQAVEALRLIEKEGK